MINFDRYICEDCKNFCDYVHNIEDLEMYYVCENCLNSYTVCNQCSAAYKYECPDGCTNLYNCEICNTLTCLHSSINPELEEGQNCDICSIWYCNDCGKLPIRNDDKYLAVCKNCYNEDMENEYY